MGMRVALRDPPLVNEWPASKHGNPLELCEQCLGGSWDKHVWVTDPLAHVYSAILSP